MTSSVVTNPSARIGVERIIWLVTLNQFVFMTGYSLTSGNFINYFSASIGVRSYLGTGVILILPELAATLGIWARSAIEQYGWQRRRTWSRGLLIARFIAVLILLIPAILWLRNGTTETGAALFVWLFFLSQVAHAFSFAAYLSWLSDLIPARAWGIAFGVRGVADVFARILFPLLASRIKLLIPQRQGASQEFSYYATLFLIGGLLQVASILPMRRLPEIPMRRVYSGSTLLALRQTLADRSLRFALACSCWLAFFQGLTQTVFFRLQRDFLGIDLPRAQEFTSLMNLLQIPLALLSGWLCDRWSVKWVLLGSLLLVSLAAPMWLYVKGEPALLWLIYSVWGLFGAVNVALPLLFLRISPRSDNAHQIAISRYISGLLAAVAGLLGSTFLDVCVRHPQWIPENWGTSSYGPMMLLVGISTFGRMTAPLWLLGVTVKATATPDPPADHSEINSSPTSSSRQG